MKEREREREKIQCAKHQGNKEKENKEDKHLQQRDPIRWWEAKDNEENCPFRKTKTRHLLWKLFIGLSTFEIEWRGNKKGRASMHKLKWDKKESLSAFWIVSIWVWNITNKHISKENPNEWLIAIYFENCLWQLHCRGSGCLDTRNGQPELTALSSVLHLRTASCPKLTAVWFTLLKGQRRTQFPWLSYSSRLNRSWFAEEP